MSRSSFYNSLRNYWRLLGDQSSQRLKVIPDTIKINRQLDKFIFDLHQPPLYVDSKNIDELRHVLGDASILAIDTETQPAFVKGRTYPTSIIQVAIRKSTQQEVVVIVDLLDICKAEKSMSRLDDILKPVFTSSSILKVGQSLKADLVEMCRAYPTMEAFQTVNNVLCTIAFNKKLDPTIFQSVSLKTLTEKYLDKLLDKNRRIRCGNWARRPLTREQLDYAACDALVLLRLLDSMTLVAKNDEQFQLNSITTTFRACDILPQKNKDVRLQPKGLSEHNLQPKMLVTN